MGWTNDEMRKVILSGIEDANRTHLRWTRNSWVSDYGAEGLIQVRIAEAIHDAGKRIGDDAGVWLEVNVSEMFDGRIAAALKQAGMMGQARPDISTFRCDADRNWTIPHVIEVKRQWSNVPIADDFARCARFAYYGGGDPAIGFEGAFVAVFLHSTMRDKRKDFFRADGEGEAEATSRIEDLLEERVDLALRSKRVRVANHVKVQVEFGAEESFQGDPTWLPVDEQNAYDRWRWRAAVIQFTPE